MMVLAPELQFRGFKVTCPFCKECNENNVKTLGFIRPPRLFFNDKGGKIIIIIILLLLYYYY